MKSNGKYYTKHCAQCTYTCAKGLVKLIPRLKGSLASTCLQAAFTLIDPKSAKKISQFKQLFALLVSASVKAARKHVYEIVPILPGFFT